MTVEELIESLEHLPAAVIVLVQASAPEAGYTPFTLQRRHVAPSKPEGYWDGEYRDSAAAPQPDLRVPAVILERHHKKLP